MSTIMRETLLRLDRKKIERKKQTNKHSDRELVEDYARGCITTLHNKLCTHGTERPWSSAVCGRVAAVATAATAATAAATTAPETHKCE